MVVLAELSAMVTKRPLVCILYSYLVLTGLLREHSQREIPTVSQPGDYRVLHGVVTPGSPRVSLLL